MLLRRSRVFSGHDAPPLFPGGVCELFQDLKDVCSALWPLLWIAVKQACNELSKPCWNDSELPPGEEVLFRLLRGILTREHVMEDGT